MPVGRLSSAVAVHVASRRWLLFSLSIMSRRVCIVLLLASVAVGAVGAYLISFWPLPHKNPRLSEHAVERGIPGVPSDPSELLGKYCKSDGTSTVWFSLASNGTYFASWDADIGNAGKAAGTWSLSSTQLVLSPSKVSGMMAGYLSALDSYRFKSNWFFVSVQDREAYNNFGLEGTPFLYRKDDRGK